MKLPYIDKPTGYSLFAHEIVPIPESWAAKTCNLVSFNQHDRGGHFAVCGFLHETCLPLPLSVCVYARLNADCCCNQSRPWRNHMSCSPMSRNTSGERGRLS